MKKIIMILCLFVFANSAFAVPNYTYTRIENEYHSSSLPDGHYVRYNTPPQEYYTNDAYYIDDNNCYNINYIAREPAPHAIQDSYIPQYHTNRRVITETIQYDREKADKIIDRTGKIAGTLGFLGLVTMGIIGIAHAL